MRWSRVNFSQSNREESGAEGHYQSRCISNTLYSGSAISRISLIPKIYTSSLPHFQGLKNSTPKWAISSLPKILSVSIKMEELKPGSTTTSLLTTPSALQIKKPSPLIFPGKVSKPWSNKLSHSSNSTQSKTTSPHHPFPNILQTGIKIAQSHLNQLETSSLPTLIRITHKSLSNSSQFSNSSTKLTPPLRTTNTFLIFPKRYSISKAYFPWRFPSPSPNLPSNVTSLASPPTTRYKQ